MTHRVAAQIGVGFEQSVEAPQPSQFPDTQLGFSVLLEEHSAFVEHVPQVPSVHIGVGFEQLADIPHATHILLTQFGVEAFLAVH